MLEKLSEDKLKRLIVSVTVSGTLLLFVLICVIVYQFVSMGVKSSQINAYERQLVAIDKELEENEDLLAYYGSDEYKEIRAMKNGYQYPDDGE